MEDNNVDKRTTIVLIIIIIILILLLGGCGYNIHLKQTEINEKKNPTTYGTMPRISSTSTTSINRTSSDVLTTDPSKPTSSTNTSSSSVTTKGTTSSTSTKSTTKSTSKSTTKSTSKSTSKTTKGDTYTYDAEYDGLALYDFTVYKNDEPIPDNPSGWILKSGSSDITTSTNAYFSASKKVIGNAKSCGILRLYDPSTKKTYNVEASVNCEELDE